MIKVEEKLFQNRYRVDAGRAHIQIRRPGRLPAQVRNEALPGVLPRLLLHQGGRRSGYVDHRRMPGMRHLPCGLQ